MNELTIRKYANDRYTLEIVTNVETIKNLVQTAQQMQIIPTLIHTRHITLNCNAAQAYKLVDSLYNKSLDDEVLLEWCEKIKQATGLNENQAVELAKRNSAAASAA